MATDDGYMHVEFESLAQLFTDLGSIHDAGNTTVENLEQALSTNLSQWSSDARDYYNSVSASWLNTFATMAQQLAAAKALVSDAQDLYVTAENRNVGIWG